MTGARMLESVVAAVAGPDGVEAYVAAMLQDRYKRSDQYAPRSRKKCEARLVKSLLDLLATGLLPP